MLRGWGWVGLFGGERVAGRVCVWGGGGGSSREKRGGGSGRAQGAI